MCINNTYGYYQIGLDIDDYLQDTVSAEKIYDKCLRSQDPEMTFKKVINSIDDRPDNRHPGLQELKEDCIHLIPMAKSEEACLFLLFINALPQHTIDGSLPKMTQ